MAFPTAESTIELRVADSDRFDPDLLLGSSPYDSDQDDDVKVAESDC